MSSPSSPNSDTLFSSSRIPTSAPSSPPPADEENSRKMAVDTSFTEEQLRLEESKAQEENAKAEAKRLAQSRRKPKKKALTQAERNERARDLEELLRKSKAFSDIITQKTKVLGRVGRDFDNKALADVGVQLKSQPKNVVGGTMRDYQLEGLTWLFEICLQGLSGILADEMGLGKTIQTISMMAHLRLEENFYGPFLILAPLSTLSNWQDEFQKWTPSIPFCLYHGTPDARRDIFKTKIMRHLDRSGKPSEKFPVVCTSYEMILRDHASLSKIEWQIIVVDEGHRLKNAEAKLFKQLQTFKSASRFLITGTPLQNNLKELWSLLHFLFPATFVDWEAFETWFDFSANIQDEEGTEQFIQDRENHELVKKIHKVLQPMLLRRIKADVAHYLPKKREYVLFAPMTKEQTDLYNVISDKNIDTRAYLENKAAEKLTKKVSTPVSSKGTSRSTSRANSTHAVERATPPTDAFSMMMMGGKRKSLRSKVDVKEESPKEAPATRDSSKKRKGTSLKESPESKSAKTSRDSTPAGSIRTRGRGRPRRSQPAYKVSDDSDDDKLDDDEFEKKLAEELAAKQQSEEEEDFRDDEEIERAANMELAKIQIAEKKLGNPVMQLRLTCNTPHNFYNPWAFDTNIPVDESIVTASGKMLLLDRLLPELFRRGHKVLIFSQFKTQLDILHDYCSELRKWKVCRIDGSVAQDERRRQIKEFNEDPKFKIFLLSTRAGGLGINLTSADTVILFDSDWNPQQDLQAQDRCHRIGQTRPVVIYRLATKGTVEEELLMSADAKRRLEKLVIKKGGYKNMDQRIGQNEALDKETLRALLLKDGEVYKHSGGDRIFSDEDLDVLCDRSDEAYDRAASGAGNAAGFQVVETGESGITQMTAK